MVLNIFQVSCFLLTECGPAISFFLSSYIHRSKQIVSSAKIKCSAVNSGFITSLHIVIKLQTLTSDDHPRTVELSTISTSVGIPKYVRYTSPFQTLGDQNHTNSSYCISSVILTVEP